VIANANRAAHRRRVALDAPPASKPEVRAFDEAVQRRGELRWALRPSELESHVVSAEYRVGRPEDARCRVAREGVDPRLVGLVVDAEANEDAIVRPAVFERWLADSHDQHADSNTTAVTPEPFARQAQPGRWPPGSAVAPGRSSLRSTDGPTGVVGDENLEPDGKSWLGRTLQSAPGTE